MLGSEGQAIAIASGKQHVFATLPTGPHWSDRVDHVARRKPEARRDLRLPRLAAAKPGASLGERRPCGTVDGAADAAAGGQHRVGGIDDGMDLEPGDVAFDESGMTLLETPDGVGIKPTIEAAGRSLPRPIRTTGSPSGSRR